jgi:predicted transcriptional regulator
MSPTRIQRRAFLTGVAAAPVALAATTAQGAPRKGDEFPAFRAENLEGSERTQTDLRGRQTFVVVVTSPAAADRMTAWIRAAQARYTDQRLRRVVFLALDLAVVVPAFLVRDKARGKVPRAYWKDTFVDAHGALAEQLGVHAGSDAPWVYVLDPLGRVKAVARGALSDKTAAPIWAAVATT